MFEIGTFGLPVYRQGAGVVFAGFGDSHQPPQAQPWQHGHGLGQGQCLVWGDTRFARTRVNIDLNAHIERRHFRGSLFAQTLCNLESVHRVHPVKVLRYQACFVALDWSDAVPDQPVLGYKKLTKTMNDALSLSRYLNLSVKA